LPDDLMALLVLGGVPKTRVVAEVQRDIPCNGRAAEPFSDWRSASASVSG
jgi:hypothetical protein